MITSSTTTKYPSGVHRCLYLYTNGDATRGTVVRLNLVISSVIHHVTATDKTTLRTLVSDMAFVPATVQILRNWDRIVSNKNSPTLTARLWYDASMGHPLDGRDIQQFLNLHGDTAINLDPNQISGVLGRVLEAFCDASAAAATSRLHVGLTTGYLNHITMNQHLTPRQRSEFYRLLGRLGEHLRMAEEESASKYLTEALLTGLSIQYDRWKTSYMASAQTAAMQMGNKGAGRTGGTFGSAGMLRAENWRWWRDDAQQTMYFRPSIALRKHLETVVESLLHPWSKSALTTIQLLRFSSE